MTEYTYDVDYYLLRTGSEKAIMAHETFDNYPDAMNCYKQFKSAISAELTHGELVNWFVMLARVYMKGQYRRNETLKSEGTI